MMGGGRGGGFFTETHGWRASEAFAKGTLLAAAAQNTATDAGSTSGGMLDALRPWWSYPYGHPEKTKNIKLLQGLLKSEAEKMANGFLYMPGPPNLQLELMLYGIELFKKMQKH